MEHDHDLTRPGQIGLNFTRLNDPQIETALLQGRNTSDQATRVSAYKTVNQRLAKDLAYLWIEQYFFSQVSEDRVQDLASRTLPDGMPGYAFDEGIFVPTQVWLKG